MARSQFRITQLHRHSSHTLIPEPKAYIANANCIILMIRVCRQTLRQLVYLGARKGSSPGDRGSQAVAHIKKYYFGDSSFINMTSPGVKEGDIRGTLS